jgi:phosphoglycolate phosphatase
MPRFSRNCSEILRYTCHDIIYLMPIKLILFDLDGTLVDTVKDITNALNYSLSPYGVSPLSVEETKQLVGEGINRLIEAVLGGERVRLKGPVLQRFLEFYSVHLTDHSTVYSHVRETLEKLGDYKKAVISNKRESLSRDLLERLDLLKHFELVIGSDTTPERKPSAVPVVYALSHFKVEPPEAVIVGDSNYDIEAGKEAGIKTIAVTYGYRDRRYLLNADDIIESFDGLLLCLT